MNTLGGFPFVCLRGRWPQRWVCWLLGHDRRGPIITCMRCNVYLGGVDQLAPIVYIDAQFTSGPMIDREDVRVQ